MKLCYHKKYWNGVPIGNAGWLTEEKEKEKSALSTNKHSLKQGKCHAACFFCMFELKLHSKMQKMTKNGTIFDLFIRIVFKGTYY